MSLRTLKKRQSPILITSVTAELKAAGASIWLVQKSSDYTILRCTLAGKQIRLILPSPSSKLPVSVDNEKNSALHLVHDLPSLCTWLSSLNN